MADTKDWEESEKATEVGLRVPVRDEDDEEEDDEDMPLKLADERDEAKKKQQEESIGAGVEFDVSFQEGPIGLALETGWNGEGVLVKSFKKVEGRAGPAQLSKKIKAGDNLVAIDGESVEFLPFEQVMNLLKQALDRQKVLTFWRPPRFSNPVKRGSGPVGERDEEKILEAKIPFLMPPEERRDMIQGYIIRSRRADCVNFYYYTEEGDRFQMAANIEVRDSLFESKMPREFTFHNMSYGGNYKGLSEVRFQDSLIGTLKWSFIGTEFVAHDFRGASESSQLNSEVALILYDTNIFANVPNALKVIIPKWDYENMLESGLLPLHEKTLKQRYSQMPSRKRESKDYTDIPIHDQDLIVFENIKPKWDDKLLAWTLNFQGRVTKASKKNFQLGLSDESMLEDSRVADDESVDGSVDGSEEERKVRRQSMPTNDVSFLRFGKVERDRFTLDYRFPLTPFQAFAFAMTTFSKKLLCA